MLVLVVAVVGVVAFVPQTHAWVADLGGQALGVAGLTAVADDVAAPGTGLAHANSFEASSCDDDQASDETIVEAEATPIFAYCNDIPMHVAVPTDQLTEIAFHQATYSWALPMTTPLEELALEDANQNRGTGRAAEQPTGDELLDGKILRFYRWGRTGSADTAIDCGAAAGTTVFSPMTGTVVLVEPYLLYNKIPDYQIHVQPEGHPELDLVLIHLDNPQVSAGDKVYAGYTPIAQVRDLSALSGLQLAEYTAGDDPGYHTHICVNDATNPGYFGLVGAAALDEEGDVVTPATISADTPIADVDAARREAAAAAGTTDLSLFPQATSAAAETPAQ